MKIISSYPTRLQSGETTEPGKSYDVPADEAAVLIYRGHARPAPKEAAKAPTPTKEPKGSDKEPTNG